MLLQFSTWPDIEAYLERSTGVIIPIGSMEQHGPNGLIGTDALCAEIIAGQAGQQADILVGPTITMGVAQFNLGFPGTVTMRADTVMAVISDYVRSLMRHGFERFFFLNGHGGNIAPANAAFQDLYTDQSFERDRGNQPGIRCRMRSWWEYENTNTLRYELYGEWEGLHATPSEVAITQSEYPDQARNVAMEKPEKLADDYYRNFGGDKHYNADHHRRWFPDGRIGSDPSLASPEDGAKLIAAAVPEVIADYEKFLAED